MTHRVHRSAFNSPRSHISTGVRALVTSITVLASSEILCWEAFKSSVPKCRLREDSDGVLCPRSGEKNIQQSSGHKGEVFHNQRVRGHLDKSFGRVSDFQLTSVAEINNEEGVNYTYHWQLQRGDPSSEVHSLHCTGQFKSFLPSIVCIMYIHVLVFIQMLIRIDLFEVTTYTLIVKY